MSKNVESDQTKENSSGVTRRGFLKGAGFTAAGAAILDAGLLAASERSSAASDPVVMGPGVVPVTLSVSGKEHTIKIEPRTTLAEALRFELGMTGTKGKREIALEEFFITPEKNVRRENSLGADELLTEIRVPAPTVGLRSVYLKQREKESFD